MALAVELTACQRLKPGAAEILVPVLLNDLSGMNPEWALKAITRHRAKSIWWPSIGDLNNQLEFERMGERSKAASHRAREFMGTASHHQIEDGRSPEEREAERKAVVIEALGRPAKPGRVQEREQFKNRVEIKKQQQADIIKAKEAGNGDIEAGWLKLMENGESK